MPRHRNRLGKQSKEAARQCLLCVQLQRIAKFSWAFAESCLNHAEILTAVVLEADLEGNNTTARHVQKVRAKLQRVSGVCGLNKHVHRVAHTVTHVHRP